eukprot:GHVP01043283.1.p1 GENE.GHVP01043283.1~~GHVP01043283.1.p1  ORF type:complete len:147 (-),score=20.05 GHVP01043283.1:181-621(-)
MVAVKFLKLECEVLRKMIYRNLNSYRQDFYFLRCKGITKELKKYLLLTQSEINENKTSHHLKELELQMQINKQLSKKALSICSELNIFLSSGFWLPVHAGLLGCCTRLVRLLIEEENSLRKKKFERRKIARHKGISDNAASQTIIT